MGKSIIKVYIKSTWNVLSIFSLLDGIVNHEYCVRTRYKAVNSFWYKRLRTNWNLQMFASNETLRVFKQRMLIIMTRRKKRFYITTTQGLSAANKERKDVLKICVLLLDLAARIFWLFQMAKALLKDKHFFIRC